MTEVTEINIEIMKLLGQGDTMTPKQIINNLPQYTQKDIKYSIRRLREKGLIRVIPNLLDMRRVFYRLSNPDEIERGTRIKEKELEVFYQVASSTYSSNTSLEEMEAAAQTG